MNERKEIMSIPFDRSPVRDHLIQIQKVRSEFKSIKLEALGQKTFQKNSSWLGRFFLCFTCAPKRRTQSRFIRLQRASSCLRRARRFSMSSRAASESRVDGSASPVALSEDDVRFFVKSQAELCERIGTLQSIILSILLSDDGIREGDIIKQCVNETIQYNRCALDLVTSSFSLSESVRRSLEEEAKAAAQAHLASIGLDERSGVDREQVVQRGGQAQVGGNVNDMNISISSQSASSASASSLDTEQQQEYEVDSSDVNPRKRRRRPNKSNGIETALPFDVARFKQAVTSETDLSVANFDTLNCGRGEEDEEQPLAITTSVVTACQLKLEAEFSSGLRNASKIRSILGHFCCVVGGLSTFRAELVGIQHQTNRTLQSIPNLSGTQSLTDLLTSLSNTAMIDFSSATSEAENERASVRAIKKALGKGKRGNDRTLSASVLREYAIPSNAVRNMLQIVCNISAGLYFNDGFPAVELFSCSPESKRLADELCGELYGRDLDWANVSALDLIVHIVVPFLWRDACADKLRAVKLGLAIFEQSLNTNDGRINMVERKFRAAGMKSTKSSGATVQSTTDYFSSSTRRRETLLACWGLILAGPIDKKTPASFLEEHGGFARRALGMSWKNLIQCCRRVVSADFFGTDSEASFQSLCNEADLGPLPKKAAKEVETKVVIYNRQQMDSLQALARFED